MPAVGRPSNETAKPVDTRSAGFVRFLAQKWTVRYQASTRKVLRTGWPQ
jgi:hypothetical protein